MTIKSLVKEAKKLSVDERTILAHEIWATVEKECDEAPVSQEVKDELDRRWREHLRNPEAGLSPAEVKKKLLRSTLHP